MSVPPPKIPVCVPHLEGNEERYVTEAIRGGWISSVGPAVAEFESRFAAWCGASHGVAVSSGTAALHVALSALDIGPGDEVVIPDFAMVAVLFAVLYRGAKPILVDAEPDTWNLDVEALERAVTPRCKAIVALHTYGHPCDMRAIREIANRHGAVVIEDGAEAHGAEIDGQRVGSLGDLAAFSFYANKIVTTGEGGMVVTNDAAIADRCRYFRNLCFPLDRPRDFLHDEIGFNYRLTNLQAALGLAQLERADELVEARRRNARGYIERLRGIPGLRLPVERPGAKNVHWMFALLVDPQRFPRRRDVLAAELAARGIETRPFFQPMHVQPPYRQVCPEDASTTYPVADRLAAQGLYLPSSSGLTEPEIERVCEAIRDVARAR